jgi:dGTPase
LTNIADEVAYNNHDVDDGLRYGLIEVEQLRDLKVFARQHDIVLKTYPDLAPRRVIHETIRRMINYLVVDLIENSQRLIQGSGVASIDDVRQAGKGLIAYSDAVREESLELKRFLRKQLYNHFRVRRMSQKSVRMLKEMFQAFLNDPLLLPPQYQEKVGLPTGGAGAQGVALTVSDYIAGMTDRYALLEYQRLFSPDSSV